MRKLVSLPLVFLVLVACNTAVERHADSGTMPLQGTWKLLTGTLIEKGDTTVTDYTSGIAFIKVINDNHFAFLSHDLNRGKDSAAMYSSGGGPYSLHDSTYTEHLEFCGDRQWEGNDFTFTISIKDDTLVQKGIEKIDSLGVNRINIEKYVRLKD